MDKLPLLENIETNEDEYNPEEDFDVKIDEDKNQYIDMTPKLNPDIIFKKTPKPKKNKKELMSNLKKEEYLIKPDTPLKEPEPPSPTPSPTPEPLKEEIPKNKVKCDNCGSIISKTGLSKHKKTKKCMSYTMNEKLEPKSEKNPQLNIPKPRVIQSTTLDNNNIPKMNLSDNDNFNQFLRHYEKLKDIEAKENENQSLVEQIIEKKNNRRRKQKLEKEFIKQTEPVKEVVKEVQVVKEVVKEPINILQPQVTNPYASYFS